MRLGVRRVRRSRPPPPARYTRSPPPLREGGYRQSRLAMLPCREAAGRGTVRRVVAGAKDESVHPKAAGVKTKKTRKTDNLRQFVAEEISARRQLAHVKQSPLAIRSRVKRPGRHRRLPEPHPANQDVPERVEIDRCVCKSKREVVAGEDSPGRRAQLIERLLERRRFRTEFGLKAPERDRVLNFRAEEVEPETPVEPDFSSKQVDGLNAKRAFMNRIEPIVAIEAFDRKVARVAIAAENLDGVLIGFQTMLGRPALGDRGQHA